MSHDIQAIDAVVNIWTAEALAARPPRKNFYVDKMRVDQGTFDGVSLESMIARMDAAGIERSFLIAAKVGSGPGCGRGYGPAWLRPRRIRGRTRSAPQR